MPLFGKAQKTPAEVVKTLKDAILALDKGDKKADKVSLVNLRFIGHIVQNVNYFNFSLARQVDLMQSDLINLSF